MVVTSYNHGNKIYAKQTILDNNVNGVKWYYCDNDKPLIVPRKCPRCQKLPDRDYDACTGYLDFEIVVACCCGHGVKKPYIMFSNSGTAYFDTVEEYWEVINEIKEWQERLDEVEIVTPIQKFTKSIITKDFLVSEKELFFKSYCPFRKLYQKYPERFEYVFGRTTDPEEVMYDIIATLDRKWFIFIQECGRCDDEVSNDCLTSLEVNYNVK